MLEIEIRDEASLFSWGTISKEQKKDVDEALLGDKPETVILKSNTKNNMKKGRVIIAKCKPLLVSISYEMSFFLPVENIHSRIQGSFREGYPGKLIERMFSLSISDHPTWDHNDGSILIHRDSGSIIKDRACNSDSLVYILSEAEKDFDLTCVEKMKKLLIKTDDTIMLFKQTYNEYGLAPGER